MIQSYVECIFVWTRHAWQARSSYVIIAQCCVDVVIEEILTDVCT